MVFDYRQHGSGTKVARRSTGKFSFVDTLASLIVNKRFSKGYEDFATDKDTRDAFIFEALSAIGNDIGDVLYQNVLHYVDNVSNIDTCKISALKSMMTLYGLEYRMFDEVNMLPVELQDMIDIFSINRKYLMKSGFMKSELLSDLIDDGIITHNDISLESTMEPDALSAGLSVSDTFSDSMWTGYLRSAYTNVMRSFLEMNYIDDGSIPTGFPIWKSDSFIAEYLSGTQDRYSEKKKLLNIDPAFNPIESVDRIEDGFAELSDFHGNELSLVNDEIQYRTDKDSSISTDWEDGYKLNMTRYSYYRRRKVLEYAKFIDNKIYIDDFGLDNAFIYDIDNNYFELLCNPEHRVIETVDGKADKINIDMIDRVAESLADITIRIAGIREKMKIQTRKNYTKGSFNLLSYLVNEFLLEYANSRQVKMIPEADLVKSCLSAHAIEDVEIVEYYDTTEYYNIRNKNTANALGGDSANPRFWEADAADLTEFDVAFNTSEIERFYLSTLNSNDAESRKGFNEDGSLYDFLCAIYDIGADPSYIDLSGTFQCQLSSGAYTYNIQPHIVSLSSNWESIQSYMTSSYVFPEGKTILEQAEDFLSDVYDRISAEHLSGISAIWDRNFETMSDISMSFNTLSNDFDSLISSFDYKTYFQRSENKYCYEDTTSEDPDEWIYNDDYRHHFFIDAEMEEKFPEIYPYWQTTEYYKYFEERLTKLDTFTRDYIENYPLKTMVSDIKFSFRDLSGSVMSDVINPIVGSLGFTDPRSMTIPGELDSALEFLNKLCDLRRQQIMEALTSLKDTLDSLNAQYNEFVTKSLGIIEGYSSTGPEQMGQICQFGFVSASKKQRYSYPLYRIADITTEDYDYMWSYKVDALGNKTGMKYYTSEPKSEDKDGRGIVALDLTDPENFFDPNDALDIDVEDCAIAEGDDNETKLRKIRSWVSHATAFTAKPAFITDSEADHEEDEEEDEEEYSYYGYWKIKPGTLYRPYANESIRSSCTMYLDMLDKIKSSMSDIMTSASRWVDLPSGDDIGDKIASLLGSINDLLGDSDLFSEDEYIKQYNEYISRIYELSGDYNPIYQDYRNIQNDDEQKVYIADFILQTDLTEDVLDRLLGYIEKRDRNAKKELTRTVKDMALSYDEINTRLDEFCLDLATEFEEVQFAPYHSYFEDSYSKMVSMLELEIQRKLDKAWAVIQDEKDKVFGYMDGVLNEFQRFWTATDKMDDDYKVIETSVDIETATDILSDAVISRMDELNYTEYPEYLERYAYFLTYTGTDDSADPYYNTKNTAHASYQIHPYLSSFVETGIFNRMMLTTYNTGIIDELRDEKIATYISGFIGDFGETIGKWLYDARDYSGYRSRYESSPHEIRIKNRYETSPLVDYDGVFYPPAVEYIRSHSNDDIVESVLRADTDDDSFYARFYSHLSLTEQQRIHISEQLQAYLDDIRDIVQTRDVDSEHEVYDIWKYGIDKFNNIIVLYKKYPSPDLTYRQKLNTRGHVWIKLADHPLAFPAFYGNTQEYETKPIKYKEGSRIYDDVVKTKIDVVKVMSAVDTTKFGTNTSIIRHMNDKSRPCIFDMEMDSGDQIIAFSAACPSTHKIADGTVFIDYDLPENENARYDKDPDCRSCIHPDIVVSKILVQKVGSNDYDSICFISREDSGFRVDINTFDGRYFVRPGYSFEGFCKPKDATIGFCLVETEVEGTLGQSGTGEPAYNILVSKPGSVTCKLMEYTKDFDKFTDGGTFYLTCPDGFVPAVSDVFSYSYAEEFCTMAFKAKRVMSNGRYEEIRTKHNSRSPNYPESTHSTNTEEWNSFDSFDSYLAIFRCRNIHGKIETVGISMANLNADASYTPHYPGVKGYLELVGENYSVVELLGQSKNIDREIALVNPNPNPYFDMDEIRNNYLFGRVYENYDPSEDKTLALAKNPLLVYDSMYDSDGNMEISWDIDVSQYADYTELDYSRMSFFLFNMDAKGKNPYYVGELADISSTSWADLYYMEASAGWDKDITDTDIKVTGTYDFYSGLVNMDDTNRLPRITGIKARFNPDSKTMEIRFMVEDGTTSTFISRDKIVAVFANPKDLTMFKYYHLLDAYGMYKSEYSRVGIGTEPYPPSEGVVTEETVNDQDKVVVSLDGWKLLPGNSYWDW